MTLPLADGHEVVVNLVTKGEIFGEIALLGARRRTADAVAISDCEMFVIERRSAAVSGTPNVLANVAARGP